MNNHDSRCGKLEGKPKKLPFIFIKKVNIGDFFTISQ